MINNDKVRGYLKTFFFIILFAWISFFPENIQDKYKIYTWIFLSIFLLALIFNKEYLKKLFVPQDIPFWLFLISMSSGIIYAVNKGLAFMAYINIALTAFLFFYLGKGLYRDKKSISRVALVICICSLLIALIGILELYFGRNILYENFIPNPYYDRYIKEQLRPMSTQLNPVILGSFLIGCLPFSFYFLNNKSFYLRLLGALSGLLCLSMIILTFSRGVFLGLLVMLSVYLWVRRKRKLLVLFFLSLVIFVSVCSYQKDDNLKRFGFKMMISGSYDSIISKYRLTRINIAMKILKDYPFVGVGFKHFRINFDKYCDIIKKGKVVNYEFMIPDNMYLTFLAETGLIGAGGFLFFISFVILSAVKRFRRLKEKYEKEELLIPMLALIGLLVNMGAYELFYWHNPYMLFCLICGFLRANS